MILQSWPSTIYGQNCQNDAGKRCKQHLQTCQNYRTRELLETDRCPRFETPSSRSRENFLRRSGKTSKGNPTKSRGAIPRFLRSIVFVFFFGCWVLVSCWCFAIFRVWLSVCMDFKEGQSAERFTQSDPTPVLDMMRWGWPQGLQLHCGYLLYRLMALVIWRMKLTRPISNALFAYRRVATHQTKKMSMFAFYSLTFNGT